MIAQLRDEHPDAPLARVCDLIDWPALRRTGEGYDAYMNRIYGPAELL